MKNKLPIAFILGLALLGALAEIASGGRGGGRGGGGGGRGGGIGGGGGGINRGGAIQGGFGGGKVGGGNIGGGSVGGIRPPVGPGGAGGIGGIGGPKIGGGPVGGHPGFSSPGFGGIGGAGGVGGPGGVGGIGGAGGIGGGIGGVGGPGKGIGGVGGVGGPGGIGGVGGPGGVGGKGVGGIGGPGGVGGPGGIGGVGQGSLGDKYKGGINLGPKGGIGDKGHGIAGGGFGGKGGNNINIGNINNGTSYRSNNVLRNQGVSVRNAVANYPCFRPNWRVDHPGAWFAAGWAANAVWRSCTWDNYAAFCSYPGYAPYYDYGDSIVYTDNYVYIDGKQSYTAQEYANKATEIAEAGRQANPTKDEEWLPLGVFAMVEGDAQTSNYIFQLAVNKAGIIRGNYYDAVTDSTTPVYGSVYKTTQRAAWTVGDKKAPVFEAGIANLTQAETTMLVHYSADRTQQYTLVRIEEPEKSELP